MSGVGGRGAGDAEIRAGSETVSETQRLAALSYTPGRIEVQLQCGSCDRIEWCNLLEQDDLGRRESYLALNPPEGWYVGVSPYPDRHHVQCPEHNPYRSPENDETGPSKSED